MNTTLHMFQTFDIPMYNRRLRVRGGSETLTIMGLYELGEQTPLHLGLGKQR